MKKIFTPTLLALFISNLATAQFQRHYGGLGNDIAYSIQPTTNGYVIAGETDSHGIGGTDGYIMRTDLNGVIVWTKTYGTSDPDWINSVKKTIDGGYVFVGGTETVGIGYIVIAKTDSGGIITWQKQLAGTYYSNGYDVIVTKDSGFAVCGFISNGDSLGDKVCLVKLNSSGTVEWSKIYDLGTTEDAAYSLVQMTNGGYVLAGETYDDAGLQDNALVIVTDASGTVQWVRTYGGSTFSWANAVTLSGAGDIILCGSVYLTNYNDIWLSKINPNGTVVWSKSFEGLNAKTDNSWWLVPTSDGGYALAGSTNSFTTDFETLLMKTDSAGDKQWVKRYGGAGNDYANQVTQASDSGFAMAGGSTSFTINTQIYFIKTNSSGVSGCNETDITLTQSSITTPASISTVTTNNAPVAFPASFTTTTPLMLQYTLCGVGVEETAASKFSIFPNPAIRAFNISLKEEFATADLHLINTSGEIVLQKKLTSQLNNLELDLPAGLYFVRISANDQIITEKLMIE